MSLKEYNDLNKEITEIYTETCIPCMKSPLFTKGDCKECSTMEEYTFLQEKKKEMEVVANG